jgi:hypothetical protein
MGEIYVMHQLTSVCTSAVDEIYLQVKGCPPRFSSSQYIKVISMHETSIICA